MSRNRAFFFLSKTYKHEYTPQPGSQVFLLCQKEM